MKKINSCCFTGYRPEKFSFEFSVDNPEYVAFENKLMQAIFALPDQGCDTFYTGMAAGFDILAAELVLLLKSRANCIINLICAVPFRGQNASFPDEWKQRYENVLAQADKIIVLSDRYYRGCYRKRNEFMVDNSDIIVTYFDGVPGGTCETLRYAHNNKKQIVNIAESPDSDIVYRDFDGIAVLEEEEQ